MLGLEDERLAFDRFRDSGAASGRLAGRLGTARNPHRLAAGQAGVEGTSAPTRISSLSSSRALMNLLQDLRFAVRLLVKDHWFTLVAVIALALGLGVNTTVFTFVNAVLIRGLPFDDPDRIIVVGSTDARGRRSRRLASRLRGLARGRPRILRPGAVQRHDR